ncbi:MAG: hypothetical protein JWM33_1329 [Caulobacteraceae bacterium]|nr:hypothetical protein [Caulobacteraceae bacterium]
MKKEAAKMSIALHAFAWAIAAAAVSPQADAAEPPGPEQLSSQVVGVVGSGLLLSLELRTAAGQPVRVLSLGDIYAEGWALTALTPSAATLTRSGESRSIGLNPAGALDQTGEAPPSQVNILVSPADLARLKAEGWDGAPAPGLTAEETQRSLLFSLKVDDAIMASRAGVAAGSPVPVLSDSDIRAMVGEAAWLDRQALIRKSMIATRQAALDGGDINRVRLIDGLPAIGPDSFYAPPGTAMDAAAKAVGLTSTVGYSSRLEADGGHTLTKLPGTGQSTIPGAPAP